MALYLAGERREEGSRSGRLKLAVLLPLIAFAAILLPAGSVWLLTMDATANIREIATGRDAAPDEASRLIDREVEILNTKAIAVFGLLAVLLARRHVRRLEFLTEIASHLAGPGREVRVRPRGCEEVQALARAMNRLSRTITVERRRFADSERRHRTLLETMSEGFVIVDSKEIIVYANRREWPAATNSTGTEPTAPR